MSKITELVKAALPARVLSLESGNTPLVVSHTFWANTSGAQEPVAELAEAEVSPLVVGNQSEQLRRILDLTGVSDVRLVLVGDGAGEGGLVLSIGAQYSLDGGATWDYADGATGPSTSMPAELGVVVATPWVALTSAAKADALWRVVTAGGDGTGFVYVTTAQLQAR